MSNQRGSWKQIGDVGIWVQTLLATISGHEVISIDQLGDMYATNPETEKSRQVNTEKYTNSRFLLSTSNEIYSIDSDGSFIVTQTSAGSCKMVGEFATYSSTVMAIMSGVEMITVGKSGACYVTKPSGEWRKLNEDNFSNVQFFFSGEKYFFIIENNTLYQVNPESGAYKKLGNEGDFANTTIGVGMNDNVYVLENTGIIWEVNGETAEYKKVGDGTFLNTKMLFAGNSKLYTIEPTGCLYEIYL